MEGFFSSFSPSPLLAFTLLEPKPALDIFTCSNQVKSFLPCACAVALSKLFLATLPTSVLLQQRFLLVFIPCISHLSSNQHSRQTSPRRYHFESLFQPSTLLLQSKTTHSRKLREDKIWTKLLFLYWRDASHTNTHIYTYTYTQRQTSPVEEQRLNSHSIAILFLKINTGLYLSSSRFHSRYINKTHQNKGSTWSPRK